MKFTTLLHIRFTPEELDELQQAWREWQSRNPDVGGPRARSLSAFIRGLLAASLVHDVDRFL